MPDEIRQSVISLLKQQPLKPQSRQK